VLFVNAKVFPGTGEHDFASAFRIEDGVFTWVGDEPEVTGGTDLGGRTVVPGFLDVHSHPSLLASLADAVPCLPPGIDSLAGLIERLRTAPGVGGTEWIEGYGFDESGWPEGRKPTRHDLDRVSTTRPVYVRRCDSHSLVCNTRALELAGITRDTPDPEGGRIGRDAVGEPDGLLAERPAWDRLLSLRPPVGHDQQVARLAGLDAHFAERGIVAVADLMATLTTGDPLRLFRDAGRAGLRLLYTGRARLVTPFEKVGLIQAGFEGSFVVLDRDVFTVAPREIGHVRVAETWIRGEQVFRR
jgi:predicted amidohydrolase YtcJ